MKKQLLLFIFWCFASLSYGQFDLASILEAPYSSNLTKSADGNVIAWVTDTKGIRTVHSYNLSLDTLLTHFSSQVDNGQIVSGLHMDDAGSWLYFHSGSGSNRNGEAANPYGTSNYPERLLLRVHIGTNKLDTVGAHGNYVIDPKGDYLLLLKGNRLTKWDVATKKTEELIRMRGVFSGVKIAPDGGSIIFESNRGDHSFIGHYRYGDERINWLSPGVDLDSEPQFSPDGQKVAFLRIPGHKKEYLNDITSGTHFQIMVHDLSDASLDTIWMSPNDAGGFAQYYHDEPLRWTKSGSIVFYSEHEGFMKIYAITEDGSGIQSVISGACEVEHSDISTDGTQVIFSSNCADINRRDIAQFDLVTGALTALTSSNDIETNPLSLKDHKLAYLKGGHRTPTAVFVNDGEEKQLSFKPNMAFPSDKLIEPKGVVFTAADGTKIHGQLFDDGSEAQKPALIFMHGGPIRQMLLGYHYSSYYANAYAFNQYMASRGYVVLSVNFRSGTGYGRDFRRAANQGPRGASEYQDIVAGANFLKTLNTVDPVRIGLWGGSYGGFLTAMGLARNSDIFKAGVDLHGVHDWAWRAKDFSEGGFWGIDEKLMQEAWNSSPVSSLDGWTSPVLFIHGDDDRNVMFGQTIDLVQRLRALNVPHEILVLPDEVHGFYRWESWLRTYRRAADFFNRKL